MIVDFTTISGRDVYSELTLLESLKHDGYDLETLKYYMNGGEELAKTQEWEQYYKRLAEGIAEQQTNVMQQLQEIADRLRGDGSPITKAKAAQELQEIADTYW